MTDPIALRRLTAGEAPFPGTLHAGDPPLVHVAAAELEGNALWELESAAHLLAPRDATTTEDGAVVILPHCVARLRDVVGTGTADGEAVTVAVSLLRGAGEADAAGLAAGEWWVTADGRPVLVPRPADADWRADAREVVALLAAGRVRALASALAEAQEALVDRRATQRGSVEAETALFAAHPAAPLDPEAAGAPEPPHVAPPATGLAAVVGDGVGRLLDAGWGARLRDVLAEVSGSLRGPTRGVRRWSRSATASAEAVDAPPRRRGPLLVAGAIAAVVVVGGALWPDAGGGRPATAAPTPYADTPQPSASTDVGPAGDAVDDRATAPPPDPADTVGQGRALLHRVDACPDEDCRAELWEDPARATPTGLAAPADVQLVDDYGGVAVLRAGDGETERIAVIVRRDDEWLVREIYDLADQP